VFKRSTAGQYGDNYVVDVKGKEMVVFGGSVINTKMSLVEPETTIKITFLGEKKAQSTGRVYKDFKVETKK